MKILKSLVLALAVLSLASPVLAAKGGVHGKPSPTATYTIFGPLDPVTHDPVIANFGDAVAFTSDADQTQYPWLEVQVHVDGVLVFSEVKGVSNLSVDGEYPIYHLGPTTLWTSGPGDGSATLFYVTPDSHGVGRTILATSTFPVNG